MALTGLIYNTSKESDREQWRRSLAEAGLTLVDGSFEEGATANNNTDAVWYIAGGQCYTWDSTFPRDVPAKSTPASTGGVGLGAWGSVGDATLRGNLKSEADGLGDSLLTVKQPFKGSVARTQHDKNAEIVNVRDFGAIGDGVTDDSPAFQAAINYIRLVDVGGNDHRSRVFGRKLYVPSGTYELKQRLVTSLGYVQNLIIEGDSELTTYLSINNPDGFIDITCTSRVASFELNSVTLLAKYGTASLQPGVGRDDTPASIAEVHDRSSGVAVKMTFPEGISTQRTKSLKMHYVS